MRTAIAVLFFALAFWRAAADWMSTIGEGYAYRFGTAGGFAGDHWPDAVGRLVGGLRSMGPSWAWDPVGAFVLSLPVAPLLAAVGVSFWIARERRGTRARTRW